MRSPRAVLVFLGAAALVFPAGRSGQSSSQAKPRTEKQSSFTRLRVEVTAGEKNQPVENASVYVRFAQGRLLGKEKKTEMNVKTNHDGIVKVPDVLRGKVLIQVVAEGWKTFGRWYDIEGEEQTIKIHLEKPPRWY
ncbi:MAG TPA: hypothetical protein VKE24_02860 [Candidatus Acidoferrales bacterium]|nr:hypothetical protein [Candidatus Acidoferrales bacterium]